MKVDEVLKQYRMTKSIKHTSRLLNTSEAFVRKVLISQGVVSTPLSRRVAELAQMGMSSKDIASTLGISLSAVNVNRPYKRMSYKEDFKTPNALAIRRYREKKRLAQSR